MFRSGARLSKHPPIDVERTDAPDMITWDDDPNTFRAKMPCGHAITPCTLTQWCRSLLDSNQYDFRCPYIYPNTGNPGQRCNKSWDYDYVQRVAQLTEDERRYFETRISQNYLQRAMGIQECPSCQSLCKRRNATDRRVVCALCTKGRSRSYDFCWYCLHEWVNTDSTTTCGNPECSGMDPRLRILKTCKKKAVVGLEGCPAIRACPTCGALIEHKDHCKQMACLCGAKFCFICLKLAMNGEYQCGSYNALCHIAAIQTTIAGQ